MIEVWKDVVGYEGIYEISNTAKVRTHKNKRTYTQKHGMRKWKQRTLKPKYSEKDRCYRFNLWENGKEKTFLLHRLLAEAFLGVPKVKMTVNHKDGNRLNNKIENLEWLTLKDNIIHAFESGLHSNCHPVKYKNIKYRSKSEMRRKLKIGVNKQNKMIQNGEIILL